MLATQIINFCCRTDALNDFFNPLSANPQNGQTHANNSSAVAAVECVECV